MGWKFGEGRGGNAVRSRARRAASSEEREEERGEGRGDISRVRRAKCASVVISGIRGGAVPKPRRGRTSVRMRAAIKAAVCCTRNRRSCVSYGLAEGKVESAT